MGQLAHFVTYFMRPLTRLEFLRRATDTIRLTIIQWVMASHGKCLLLWRSGYEEWLVLPSIHFLECEILLSVF